jgi:N-acyl homoserine lactone hydrolase
LPKSGPIRAATDTDPELADQTTQHVAAFHRAHPEIALIPAHDRQAYLAVFPGPDSCTAKLAPAEHRQ